MLLFIKFKQEVFAMVYKNQQGLALKLVNEFWSYINDSYTIERMYNETENVLVTLSDYKT